MTLPTLPTETKSHSPIKALLTAVVSAALLANAQPPRRALADLVIYDDTALNESAPAATADAAALYDHAYTGTLVPDDLDYVTGRWWMLGNELFAQGPALAVKRGLRLPRRYVIEARVSLYDVVFHLGDEFPSTEAYLVFDYSDAQNFKWAKVASKVMNGANVLTCSLGATVGGTTKIARPARPCLQLGNAGITTDVAVKVDRRRVVLSINGLEVISNSYADAVDRPVFGLMNETPDSTAFQTLKVRRAAH